MLKIVETACRDELGSAAPEEIAREGARRMLAAALARPK